MANEKKRQVTPEQARRRKAAKEKRMKVLKRRRRIFIASIVVVAILLVLLIMFLTGAFSHRAKETTLTLTSDNSVLFEEVTSLDNDYYSKSELKKYIKSEIKEFNKTNDGEIRLEDLDVNDDEAYLSTSYDDVSTYSLYTGYDVSYGTVQDMIDLGYDFSDTFMKVADEAKTDVATADAMSADTSAKVLVVDENTLVKVPGTILFVADSSTEVIDASSVRISQKDGNNDVTTRVIIIYK